MLQYFVAHELELEMLRLTYLTNEQMKAVLVADQVNHSLTGHGRYPIGGRIVCSHCFRWLRGLVSREPLKTASGIVVRGLPIQPHARTGMSWESAKTRDAIEWIKREANLWGEPMPGAHRSGMIYVPFFTNPDDLYEFYVAACGTRAKDADGKRQIVSKRSFIDLFKGYGKGAKELRNIQFTSPAAFKCCAQCFTLKTQLGALRKKGLDPSDPKVKEVQKERKKHLDEIARQRSQFLLMREALSSNSEFPRVVLATESGDLFWQFPDEEDVLLISTDKSTDLTHPERFVETENSTKLTQFKGLFYGVLNHTLGRGTVILSPANGVVRMVRNDDAAKLRRKQQRQGRDQGPVSQTRARPGEALQKVSVSWKGASVMCTFLLLHLHSLRQSGQCADRQHLYLQIDGGERSFSLLCLVSYLVAIGWFDKVTIASHFPGHTHEVIDAVFSELRRRLHIGRTGPQTYEEIQKIAREVYSGKPTLAKHGPIDCTEADVIYNFDRLWKGVRNLETKGLWDMRGKAQDNKPHVFQVAFDLDGQIRIPKVRSFVSASNMTPATMMRNWTPVFKPGVRLPEPRELTEMDFRAQFVEDCERLTTTLRDHPTGALGLSEDQIVSYEKLKLGPTPQGLQPFGRATLPESAWLHLCSHAQQLSQQGKKRGRRDGIVHDEESEDEAGAEEEDDDEGDDSESDFDFHQQEIVELLEVSGSARCLVRYANGTQDTVHHDNLPDWLEQRYQELLQEKREKRNALQKDVMRSSWFQNNNLTQSRRRNK